MATSVIDYIFRELAVNYLGRSDLAHVEPDFVDEEVVSERLVELDKDTDSPYNYNLATNTTLDQQKVVANEKVIMNTRVMKARQQGYTGDICTECQSLTMVRNGTCLKCTTCGSTSGCS